MPHAKPKSKCPSSLHHSLHQPFVIKSVSRNCHKGCAHYFLLGDKGTPRREPPSADRERIRHRFAGPLLRSGMSSKFCAPFCGAYFVY
ncbi:unnamed protein product [Colias eurytheme]|nr:unnamed protein product [Colias eurytheme]